MESNWRTLPFETVGADPPMRLMSRFVGPFAWYLTDIHQAVDKVEVWEANPLFPGGWAYVFATGKYPGHNGFPYGYAVDPD